MTNQTIQKIITLILIVNSSAAIAARNNDEYTEDCTPSIFTTPLPPYNPGVIPDCHALPPRPYAVPMQGVEYMWMLGGDVFFINAKPRGDYALIYEQHKVGGTGYVAWRFRNPFGLEFGLSYTDRKSQATQTVPGTVMFGQTATTNATITGQMRLKNTYLDVQAHTRLCRFIESKFILGAGWMRQSFEYRFQPINTSDPVQRAITQFQGKSTFVARLGVGAQAMVWDRVGIRGIVLYQTTNSIKIRGVPPNQSPVILRNAVSLCVGMFWTIKPLDDYHAISPN